MIMAIRAEKMEGGGGGGEGGGTYLRFDGGLGNFQTENKRLLLV